MDAAERLARAFVAEHPDEAARLLERADPADAAAVLAAVPDAVGAAVYGALGPAPAAACTAALDDAALEAIVAALPLDAAGPALRRVAPQRRAALLERLPADQRGPLAAMLEFSENSAGALADPLVLTLTEDLTVADAQRQLRSASQRFFYYLYVVARDGTLVGVLALPELMAANLRDTVANVMRRDVVRLDAAAPLATVVVHPGWRDFDALPVVDAAGRLVGAVRHKTIRRLGREGGTPMLNTIVGLSELYWAGLAGLLATFAPAATVAPAATAEPANPETPHGS